VISDHSVFFRLLPRIVIFPRVEIFFQAPRLCHNPMPIIFCLWILFPYLINHSLDTPCEAWPNTRGQAPHPAVAPLAKDRDWPTTPLPQPEAHLHLPQDFIHPSQQLLHSPDWDPPLPLVDTLGVAWPKTGGQAPHLAVAPLARDGELPPSALPQPQAHLLLPEYSLHPPQQPLHSAQAGAP